MSAVLRGVSLLLSRRLGLSATANERSAIPTANSIHHVRRQSLQIARHATVQSANKETKRECKWCLRVQYLVLT